MVLEGVMRVSFKTALVLFNGRSLRGSSLKTIKDLFLFVVMYLVDFFGFVKV
jgi:hypothetical protein